MKGVLRYMPLVLTSALAAGCIHPRVACRVSAANETGAPIASAIVEDEEGRRYVFKDLQPRTASDPVAAEDGMTRKVVLRTTGEDGTERETTVDLGCAVPSDFKGRVVFQFEDEDRVRAFVLPSEGSEESGLPWAIPPPWQGTMGIPGFSAHDAEP